MKSFLWLKTISTLSTVALPPPVGPPTDLFWLCLCLWVFWGQGCRSRPWTKRCVSRSTECSNVYSDVVVLEMDINDLTACLWGQAQRDMRG